MFGIKVRRILASEYRRLKLMRQKKVHIAYGTYVGPNVSVGRFTRINAASHLDDCEIGACCAIGGRLIVRSSNHYYSYLNMQDELQRKVIQSSVSVVGRKKSETKVGNGVWIGDSVILLSGANVGNGAVIGAGSLVTGHIPEFAVAVGVPAKVIKYRFSKEICSVLSGLNWWDWTEEQLQARKSLFETDLGSCSPEKLSFLIKE